MFKYVGNIENKVKFDELKHQLDDPDYFNY